VIASFAFSDLPTSTKLRLLSFVSHMRHSPERGAPAGKWPLLRAIYFFSTAFSLHDADNRDAPLEVRANTTTPETGRSSR